MSKTSPFMFELVCFLSLQYICLLPATYIALRTSLAEKFTSKSSAKGRSVGSMQEMPKTHLPETHHRFQVHGLQLLRVLGGNMVGRIWVCLLCGTSSQDANHCSSFVITCRARGLGLE